VIRGPRDPSSSPNVSIRLIIGIDFDDHWARTSESGAKYIGIDFDDHRARTSESGAKYIGIDFDDHRVRTSVFRAKYIGIDFDDHRARTSVFGSVGLATIIIAEFVNSPLSLPIHRDRL
jgi:uncharacterized protein (DUF736 family)